MIYADGMHGQFWLGYGAQSLHVAAATAEDGAEIERLVARGADPDARDAGGCTPLYYTVWNNYVAEVAAALFATGADREACNGYGQKPLDYAVNAINAALIDAALDAGADPAGSGDAPDRAQAGLALPAPISVGRRPTSASCWPSGGAPDTGQNRSA